MILKLTISSSRINVMLVIQTTKYACLFILFNKQYKMLTKNFFTAV